MSDTKQIVFPKRNTRFEMEDFFQLDVDDFTTGIFLFLSAKEVDIITDKELLEDVEWVSEKGIIVSTYCYTYSSYMKFLIVDFRVKPWHNTYTVRRAFTRTMGIDWMAFHGSKEDFIEWMKID